VNDEPATLLAGLLAGLEHAAPHLTGMDVFDLADAIRDLPAMGWSPLMLQRRVEHAGFPMLAITDRQLLAWLRGLGLPSVRPRSGVPLDPSECPDHPGVKLRARSCAVCVAESRLAPEVHSRHADAVRAAVRPLRATPPGGVTQPGRDGAV
jgi:hypothetical protein